MTIRDLFAGDWTWLQLLGEVGLVLVACLVAFAAGHARGWNRGFLKAQWLMDELQKLKKLSTQGSEETP